MKFFQTLMNALKETSLVIQMQLASIHKDHTTVNVKTDSKGMERRTAQVERFFYKIKSIFFHQMYYIMCENFNEYWENGCQEQGIGE